jgi:small-conductance mechanosensitive channel
VQAGDVSGRVEDIGFMQTKVQSFDGVPVLVPNQAFTSQVCHYQHLETRIEVGFVLKFWTFG